MVWCWRGHGSLLAMCANALLTLASAWKYVRYEDTRVVASAGSHLWTRSERHFADCEKRCSNSVQCQCVLWQHSNQKCFGRKDCAANGFLHDSEYKLSRKIPIPLGDLRNNQCISHKNAYWKHGAEFDINWLKAPLGLNDEQCRSRCLEDRFCNCYVRNPKDGACYKRRDCEPRQFVDDPVFITCILTREALNVTEAYWTEDKRTTTQTTTSTLKSSAQARTTTPSKNSSTARVTNSSTHDIKTNNASRSSQTNTASTSTNTNATNTTNTTVLSHASRPTRNTSSSRTPTTTTLAKTSPSNVLTTTTAEESLTSMAVPRHVVRTKMVVDGLDYAQLMDQHHFRSSFVKHIKQTLSDGVCEGTVEGGHPGAISAGCIISPSHISVRLLKGSVEVRADINCPNDMGESLASFVRMSLRSQPTLNNRVEEHVKDLCTAHSDDVCTGQVRVSHIDILKSPEVPVPIRKEQHRQHLRDRSTLMGEWVTHPSNLFWSGTILALVLLVSAASVACLRRKAEPKVEHVLPSKAPLRSASKAGEKILLDGTTVLPIDSAECARDGRNVFAHGLIPSNHFFTFFSCKAKGDPESEPLVSWWNRSARLDGGRFIKL